MAATTNGSRERRRTGAVLRLLRFLSVLAELRRKTPAMLPACYREAVAFVTSRLVYSQCSCTVENLEYRIDRQTVTIEGRTF